MHHSVRTRCFEMLFRQLLRQKKKSTTLDFGARPEPVEGKTKRCLLRMS